MNNTMLDDSAYKDFDASYYDTDDFYNRDREGDIYGFSD